MSLALFVAHKSSNDKCPELSAGQFFTGAQIPSCIFADVWSIDLIRGILVYQQAQQVRWFYAVAVTRPIQIISHLSAHSSVLSLSYCIIKVFSVMCELNIRKCVRSYAQLPYGFPGFPYILVTTRKPYILVMAVLKRPANSIFYGNCTRSHSKPVKALLSS